MICVFPSNVTDFSTLGLGAVTPTACSVTETLNGEWELTLTHPLDDNGKWTRLQVGNVIKAPVPAAPTPRVNMISQTDARVIYRVTTQVDPLNLRSGPSTTYKWIATYRKGTEVVLIAKTNDDWFEVVCPDGKRGYMSTQYLTYVRTEDSTAIATGQIIESRQLREQPFRIYRIVPELTQVTAYARHIFYDLMDNMIVSYKPNAGVSGVNVVNNIFSRTQSPHDFTVYTDLTGTADEITFENINPVEALMGDKGVTDHFTGELARDWYDVYMVKRVGTDSDIQIREAKNLLGISYDVDETNIVTRILPTGETKDGELLYLNELFIDSPYINSYPHPKWVHLHVSEARVSDDMTEAQAKAKLREAAQKALADGCDLPAITIDVDFINIGDTQEYADYKPLSDIFLGDSVRVIAPTLSMELSLRMTQYTYDCLLKRYTVCKLGAITNSVEGSLISAKQLASGSITGSKLAIASVGTGQLQHASVGSLQVKTAAIGAAHIQDAVIQTVHIADASITKAKIAEALIDTLTVNALTAVTAKIKELSAGEITTDELYTAIATIAYAQMTTANIIRADIKWANIESLAADVAKIAKASIDTAAIREANIDWAAITGLTAAVASIINASIQTADISWAQIKDLVSETAIITQGVGGEFYFTKLAVTEANLVSLTVGELVVKGKDGHFYSVTVNEQGEVVSQIKQINNDDVSDVSINAGEKLIEGSVTAATLNAQDIFGDNAIIRNLIAANLDVDKLFAREATIAALNAADITGNEYLRLMVASKADASDVLSLIERISAAELKITDDSIVSTVTGSQTYKQDQQQIYDAIENIDVGNGVNASDTPPVNPALDELWLDTSLTPNVLSRWNGSHWISVGADLSDYYTKVEMQTRLQQTDEAVALKADKSITDNLGNRLEEAETALITQAEGITANATRITTVSSNLTSLAIGSRNYVLNSHQTIEIVNAADYTNAYPAKTLVISPDFLKDCAGKMIFISYYYMQENAERSSAGYIFFRYTGRYANGTLYPFTVAQSNIGTRGWTRYTVSLTVSTSYVEITSVEFYIFGYKGTVRIRDVQIEQGSKATSYKPAPEDMMTVKDIIAPSDPYLDMLWLDISVSPNLMKRWNGTAWQIVNDTAALSSRIMAAEFKLLPDAIMTSVKASTLYRAEKYGGRNYALNSNATTTFIGGYLVNSSGQTTTGTSQTISVSDDLFEHSNNGQVLRISFDIYRYNVVPNASGYYGGIFCYYRYLSTDGVTILTTGRGYYLKSTDLDFESSRDWVRIEKAILNILPYEPISIAYFTLGTSSSAGSTGTVMFRNIKLEVGDVYTPWCAAPEDLNKIPSRMTVAESSITQNSTNIALRVLTSTYNTEKVYRGSTAPTTIYTDMLWLDTSQTPNLLKRWTSGSWVIAGADTLKTSGIYIGKNNVTITTEQFLLQLLDPADNENILMEMSAAGKVGFKELYADDVISSSVAQAYRGSVQLTVNPNWSGSSTTVFRSLGDAVKQVNNRFLSYNVSIYLPSSANTLYESTGVHITGISGPGRLAIYGYAACPLNTYMTIKGCSANILLQNITMREIRPLNGTNRNSYLIECQMDHYIEINGCTLDANNTTWDSVYLKATHALLNNTGLYNALQGLEAYTATGVMKNCKGSCSYSMMAYAGIIFAYGTVPNGTRGTGENGQVFASGVTTDYGTAIAPVTPDSTTIQYATTTRTYRGGWRTDTNDVVQGAYSDTGYSSSLAWNTGCMWFANLRNVLSGATIKSATITFHRKPGNGAFAAKSVQLCAISLTGPSGVPSIPYNVGVIGTIGRDEQQTFAIPIAVVQGLVNGTYGGLCLYEPAKNFGSSTYSDWYMRMSGSDTTKQPYLTVVYNSGAVG